MAEAGQDRDDVKRLALKSLMASFDEALSPAEAMLAAFRAASQLSPYSPEGEAAIDRIMDIASRNMRGEPQAINMLREATRMAPPRTTLAAKGLYLYMNYVRELHDPGEKASAALFVPWSVRNPPVETEKRFIKIWKDMIVDLLRAGKPEKAERSLSTVVTSPLTKGLLGREANILWPWLIDAIDYKHGYAAAIQQAKNTSSQVYELSRRPSDYAEIKEIMAHKFLDLALKANPEFDIRATMEAAKYDGPNLSLHARIARRLSYVSDMASNPAQRREVLSKMQEHIAYLRLPDQDSGAPSAPSP